MELSFHVGLSPTLHIRGIIADKNIGQDEIIERCPVILIPVRTEEQFLEKTVLWKYYFEWNADNHCLLLGYGSLINHSYTPNARYTHDFRNKVMVFRAIKPIRSGEEITVNYNYFPDSQNPLEEHLLDFNKHQPK